MMARVQSTRAIVRAERAKPIWLGPWRPEPSGDGRLWYSRDFHGVHGPAYRMICLDGPTLRPRRVLRAR